MMRTLIAATMLLLTGCATDQPLEFACRRMDEFRIPVSATPTKPGAIAAAGAGPSPLVALIAGTIGPQATSTTGARTAPDFLVLSGGGPWGAFGAGFIQGWSAKGAGETARPDRFALVTGVSTGALQATYAFLGKDLDGALVEAYRIDHENQLVKRRGNTFFLTAASMADTAPLVGYVRSRLAPLIERVGAPENAGRTLLVGVVDALDGRMYAIDLTRVARELQGPERENCYTAALLASSAVPLVFRQVTINGKPYLDGGVRQSVFVTDLQDAIEQALVATNERGRVFVIMNGDTATKRVDAVPAKILPTLDRLRTLVFNQVELTSIYNVAAKSRGMRTYVATAEGQPCDSAVSDKDAVFDPSFMTCLAAFGRERWTTGTPWRAIAPTMPPADTVR